MPTNETAAKAPDERAEDGLISVPCDRITAEMAIDIAA
jgi:hypothetical protein